MFTLHTFGPDAVDRVLAELSEEDRAALTELQAMGWCPVEPVLRYFHALDRIFGSGDLEVCVRAGHYSAGWSMNTVLKVFMRFQTPTWLVSKGTSIWSRYHDTGSWLIDSRTSNQITGQLRGFAVRDPAFCARLSGWLAGAIELTGGKHVKVVERRCACRGDEYCEFLSSW